MEAGTRPSRSLYSLIQRAVKLKVFKCRPYLCKACGKRYTQRQGLNRHDRAKHNPIIDPDLNHISSCGCCAAKWSRPYQYRNHLKKEHSVIDPDLNHISSCVYCAAKRSRPYQYRNHLKKEHSDIYPDLVPGKAAGFRRKAVFRREQPPAMNHDRQIQAVSPRPPLILPAPAAAKATNVPSTFSSTEKDTQPVNDVVDHASSLPPARPGGSTTPCSNPWPTSLHSSTPPGIRRRRNAPANVCPDFCGFEAPKTAQT